MYNLPKQYLSYSAINKYLSCPEKYRRHYVENEATEELRPAALSVGSGTHQMVEDYIKSYLRGENPTWEDIEGNVELDTFFDGTDLEEKSLDAWVGEVKKFGKVWYKGVGSTLIPTASEQAFEGLFGDVPVLGYVDYIDHSNGKPEVCDLKVVKRGKSVKDAQNSIQLAMYAEVLDNPNVRFDSVVKLKTPKLVSVSYEFSRSEINYMVDIVGEVATNISKGHFPKTSPTSWTCTETMCPFYKNCRGAY